MTVEEIKAISYVLDGPCFTVFATVAAYAFFKYSFRITTKFEIPETEGITDGSRD